MELGQVIQLGPGAATILIMQLVKQGFPNMSRRSLFFSAAGVSGALVLAYAGWSTDHGAVGSWPTVQLWAQTFAGAMGVHAGAKALLSRRQGRVSDAT